LDRDETWRFVPPTLSSKLSIRCISPRLLGRGYQVTSLDKNRGLADDELRELGATLVRGAALPAPPREDAARPGGGKGHQHPGDRSTIGIGDPRHDRIAQSVADGSGLPAAAHDP
jgi:hypothetical protein